MRKGLTLLLSCLLLYACENNTQFIGETRDFPNYSSASGIEFYKDKFYIIGDDAPQLLVLDSGLNIADSIALYSLSPRRIPKPVKPDLEAISIVTWKNENQLLLLGSGSLDSTRNVGWLINPVNRERISFRLDTFYHRLKERGLNELNIEGLCAIPGSVILSNRGHKGYPKNQLLFTSAGFWEHQQDARFSFIKIGTNEDTAQFNGVSGLAYAPGSDKLIMTVSTEDTRSVHEDGAIGKSYLWVVDNISSKKKWLAINPNRVIDLEKVSPLLKTQKIESVCVIRETKRFIELALVADNDDGSSKLFRIDISKK